MASHPEFPNAPGNHATDSELLASGVFTFAVKVIKYLIIWPLALYLVYRLAPIYLAMLGK